MVSHTDYPFHGEYKVVYSEQLEDETENIRLGMAGSSDTWILQVFTMDFGTKKFAFALLNFLGTENGSIFRTSYCLSFLNHKDRSKSKIYTKKFESKRNIALLGAMILESEVLEKNSGWLQDGKLSVAFGIYVEAIKETVWKFNFYNPTFQCDKRKDTIGFTKRENKTDRRYCHKQLLVHHGSIFAEYFRSKENRGIELEDNFKLDSLEKCLQIVHGARITIGLSELLNVLKIADHYKLYNVMRYCEMELIQRKDKIKFIKNHIQFATHYKLSRYLASVLREMESPEAIKEDLCHVDIDSMTGEMMKQCVMYLLDF